MEKKIQIVVVVDDNKENRKLLRDVLETMGYGIAAFENGDKAIKELKKFSGCKDLTEQFAIKSVITDLHMAPGDGFDVIKFVKENFPETQVVLSSAGLNSDEEKKALQLGVALLGKPIRLKELRVLIGDFPQ